MSKVIYLEEYRAKKLEEEVMETKQQLEELIEYLNIDTTPQPYYPSNDYSYYNNSDNYPIQTVADARDKVAQSLIECAMILDGVGDREWADFISDIAHEFMTNDTPPTNR